MQYQIMLIVSDNSKMCFYFETDLALLKFLSLLMNTLAAKVPALTEMIFEYRCLIT